MRTKQLVFLCGVLMAFTTAAHSEGQTAGMLLAETSVAGLGDPQPNPPLPARTESPSLSVADSAEYGSYLTDGDGRALYMLDADSQNESTCYDVCAANWPPYEAPRGNPEADDPDISEDLIDTFVRDNGPMQVSYNGFPLYYYIKDQGPGQATGQDVTDQWGTWYLLSPEGEVIDVPGSDDEES